MKGELELSVLRSRFLIRWGRRRCIGLGVRRRLSVRRGALQCRMLRATRYRYEPHSRGESKALGASGSGGGRTLQFLDAERQCRLRCAAAQRNRKGVSMNCASKKG
jgi:hypothetical protein